MVSGPTSLSLTLVVPLALVARAVRDGAEATWRTTLLLRLDVPRRFVNGAWGWRH